MKSKQNVKPFKYDYKYGRKQKYITKLSGLKQYATINRLNLFHLLAGLQFTFWFNDDQLYDYNCRLCKKELSINHVEWDRVYIQTCSCATNGKPIINLERFKTIYPEDIAVEKYKLHAKQKTANWKPINADCSSLAYHISRYGPDIGPLTYKEKCKKMDTVSPAYFQRKLAVDKKTAITLSSERQKTYTLAKLIAKHGEQKGKILHEDRQRRWQHTLNSKPLADG